TYNNTLVLAIGNSISNLEMEIIKVDATDHDIVLEGAQFNLSYSEDGVAYYYNQLGGWTSDTSLIANITSNAAGQIYISNIMPGYTYTLTEKAAPEGYDSISPIEFTISEDGIITTESQYAIADNGELIRLFVEDPTTITNLLDLLITKVDASDTSITLEGAEFYLSYVDNGMTYYYTQQGGWSTSSSLKANITTNSSGQIYISDLMAGYTYSLTEVDAPEGYELLDDAIIFNISEEGDITTNSQYAVATNGDPLALMVEDPLTNPDVITIQKVDESTGIALQGAQFDLYYIDGSQNYYYASDGQWAESQDDAMILTTSDAGIITIPTPSANTYYLEEVTAPDGYELLEDPVVFEISSDETMSIQSGDATVSSDNGLTMVVNNNPSIPPTTTTINFSVRKIWDDLNNLYGVRQDAVFTLTGTVTNEDGISTTVTTLPGSISKNNQYGIYTWSDLPVYDDSGNEIVYTVTENYMTNYITNPGTVYSTDDGYCQSFTNTYNPTAPGGPKTLTSAVTRSKTSSSSSSEPYAKTGVDTTSIAIVGIALVLVAAAAIIYAYNQHKKARRMNNNQK
ncbi:MAG: Cna B-type domain-containing protein, partial [Eggerthellaceae bacterium]|nr:Cna B-type domain-containing protein [Eggerthellaceae bacterium]